jgi:ribonuclease I
MRHGFQQIVTQAERRDNFVVHGLPPLGEEMAVSLLLWRKKLMDSISGNMG